MNQKTIIPIIRPAFLVSIGVCVRQSCSLFSLLRYRLLCCVIGCLSLILVLGCAESRLDAAPQKALQQYITAIEANHPVAAYGMLDRGMKKKISQKDFFRRWKDMRPELLEQAKALRRSKQSSLSVEAALTYASGIQVNLALDQNQWRVQDGFPMAVLLRTPLQAIKAFLRALEMNNYALAEKLLARSPSFAGEALNKQLKKIKDRLIRDRIQHPGRERFSFDLVQEQGQWKISRIR